MIDVPTTVTCCPALRTAALPSGTKYGRRDRAFDLVEQLVFDKEDEIVVGNRRQQQPFGVIRSGRGHNQAAGRRTTTPGFPSVAPPARARTGGQTNDGGNQRLAAKHVANFRPLQYQRPHAQRDEVLEPHGNGASPSPPNRWPCPLMQFSEMGVSRHVFGAELLHQALRHAERAAVDADVLAQHVHAGVRAPGPCHRFAERLGVGQLARGPRAG